MGTRFYQPNPLNVAFRLNANSLLVLCNLTVSGIVLIFKFGSYVMHSHDSPLFYSYLVSRRRMRGCTPWTMILFSFEKIRVLLICKYRCCFHSLYFAFSRSLDGF